MNFANKFNYSGQIKFRMIFLDIFKNLEKFLRKIGIAEIKIQE